MLRRLARPFAIVKANWLTALTIRNWVESSEGCALRWVAA